MARSLLKAYFIILKYQEKIAKSDESKEILTKETKKRLKRSKFHKNGNFDFLTGGQEIKFDQL